MVLICSCVALVGGIRIAWFHYLCCAEVAMLMIPVIAVLSVCFEYKSHPLKVLFLTLKSPVAVIYHDRSLLFDLSSSCVLHSHISKQTHLAKP